MTKTKRLKAYKHMLVRIQTEESIGFCNAFSDFLGKTGTNYTTIFSSLPELMEYRPEMIYGCYWFLPKTGKQKRIKILKTIIKKLEE